MFLIIKDRKKTKNANWLSVMSHYSSFLSSRILPDFLNIRAIEAAWVEARIQRNGDSQTKSVCTQLKLGIEGKQSMEVGLVDSMLNVYIRNSQFINLEMCRCLKFCTYNMYFIHLFPIEHIALPLQYLGGSKAKASLGPRDY